MSNKVASITQMKNESAILPYSLARLDELVDCAVIIDDHSEDNSIEIVKNSKMYKEDRIVLLENEDKDRKEGREFNKCFEKAKELGAKRIYISDCDEIVADRESLLIFKRFLRDDNRNIRIKRAEIAIDQASVYGLTGGSGKLIIADVDNINGFDLNATIHCSQPPTRGETVLVSEDACVLLHYGPCCVDSQIIKCLSYVLWDNFSIDKPIEQGYKEYFRTYNNFVFKGEKGLFWYICKDSILENSFPYKKWLPEELKWFCEIYSVELFHMVTDDARSDIVYQIISDFCKLDYVKENICARANTK